MYKSMGYSNYDLARPLIGLANTWNTLVPGHYNLRQVAEYVRQGVYQAGGTPAEFGVIGGCDGLANGHGGMRFILPSRELIANSVEMMVQAHRLDAVVLLGSCDKIVPGLMMAAARLELPAIIIVGGPAEGGCEFDGRPSDTTSLAEGLGMLKAGRITEEEFSNLEDRVMPHLRLLLVPGHGQLHVLRGRGPGHEPARQRHHSGAMGGQATRGPGHGAAHCGDGARGAHQRQDHQQKERGKRHTPHDGPGRLHKLRPASSRRGLRGRGGDETWTSSTRFPSPPRTWPR